MRLAADAVKIKASLSRTDLFVLKPTSKLTPSPLRLSFCTSALTDGIEYALPFSVVMSACSPVTMVSLYANKDLCLFSFTPDLVEGGGPSDRTILEQPSPKRQRDFVLKRRAGCSEYVTQVVQTTSSVCIHQWVHTHTLVVFRSWTTSTLVPCGSLLNLMIYAQTHKRTHIVLRLCAGLTCPISMETPNFQLLACQGAFVMSIIPRNNDSNFSSHTFSFSSATVAVA